MRGSTSKLLRRWCAVTNNRHRTAKKAWNKLPRPQREGTRKHLKAVVTQLNG